MDDHDIWSVRPARDGMVTELFAGVAGFACVALAMLFLLDLALGWHIAG